MQLEEVKSGRELGENHHNLQVVLSTKQSDRVLGNALLPLNFDDNWTFAHVQTVLPLTHQFIIAHSDDPSDPTIVIDPNHNEIRLLYAPTTTYRVLIGADIYTKSNDGTLQTSTVTFGNAVGFFFGFPAVTRTGH